MLAPTSPACSVKSTHCCKEALHLQSQQAVLLPHLYKPDAMVHSCCLAPKHHARAVLLAAAGNKTAPVAPVAATAEHGMLLWCSAPVSRAAATVVLHPAASNHGRHQHSPSSLPKPLAVNIMSTLPLHSTTQHRQQTYMYQSTASPIQLLLPKPTRVLGGAVSAVDTSALKGQAQPIAKHLLDVLHCTALLRHEPRIHQLPRIQRNPMLVMATCHDVLPMCTKPASQAS